MADVAQGTDEQRHTEHLAAVIAAAWISRPGSRSAEDVNQLAYFGLWVAREIIRRNRNHD